MRADGARRPPRARRLQDIALRMAAALPEAIAAAFRSVGEKLTVVSEEELAKGTGHAEMAKCVSMCKAFGLSPAELAQHWEALCVNSATETKLSVDSLERLKGDLERSRAQKSRKAAQATTPTAPRRLDSASIGALRPRSGALNAMATPTTTKRPGGAFASPDGQPLKVPRRNDGIISPESAQSPPAPSPSAGYEARQNAGQRVAEYNVKLGRRGAFEPSEAPGGLRCAVRLGNPASPDSNADTAAGAVGASERYRYMFTTLFERSDAIEASIIDLGDDLANDAMRGAPACAPITPVAVPKQEAVTIIGRVVCEAAEGRLNRTSVVIEGSRRDSGGRRVLLSMAQLKSFAFFPGQVVGIEGVFSGGNKMMVSRIFAPAPKPQLSTPVKELMRCQHSSECQGSKPLSIFVAAGPYTTSDNLDFAPFQDLLAAVKRTRPDVVILNGPFIDANHPKVSSGECEMEGDAGTESVDLETLFQINISSRIQELYADEADLPCQFVLLPSLQDAFHDFVFPQPPLADRVSGGIASPFFPDERLFALAIPGTAGEAGGSKRVFCAPNPAVVRVNELSIGAITTDVLFHMSCEEVSVNTGNRLGRLCHYMLQQRSFYPLFPPPADGPGGSPSQLDFRHAERWQMDHTPDILIAPSRLAYFAKEVDGCVCVNPGQLAKNLNGGTFAIVTVHPAPKQVLEAQMKDPEKRLPHRTHERTSVEVLRI